MEDYRDEESRTITAEFWPAWVKRTMTRLITMVGKSLVNGSVIIIEIPDVLDQERK